VFDNLCRLLTAVLRIGDMLHGRVQGFGITFSISADRRQIAVVATEPVHAQGKVFALVQRQGLQLSGIGVVDTITDRRLSVSRLNCLLRHSRHCALPKQQ
jgi:hypothetical protein